ncbi:InlB B-repeat-containing protein [Thiocystis violacea]|uniref:DUF7948 domain-containing protein n=1 Tax=Thiocystis violacea TaxID=13725 RepID=UPI001905B6FA|nr:hypothetical protein [Thiocystis violacea]MBK1724470.1 hypothetical protein [Thiocystis violacea]
MFIPNEGQWDSPVAYLSRTPGADVLFSRNDIDIQLRREGATAASVRLRPLGASPDTQLTPGQALRTRIGYFLGQDPERWRPSLVPRDSVRYRGLYAGIDLVFRNDHGSLAYDLEVTPGADPSQVRFEVSGVKRLTLDQDHVMVMTLPDGSELRQRAPVIYQDIRGERIPVDGGFVLLDSEPGHDRHIFGFRLADYDRSAALTIDPTLTYSTFVGGAADDQVQAMAVTANGEAVVVGATSSTAFSGDPEIGPRGRQDAFLYRLSSSGMVLDYVAILGGSADDRINGVALDGDDVYITGQTKSADFPTVAALYPVLPGGTAQAAFVAKLDTATSPPTLAFATYLGGTGTDAGIAIGVDDTDVHVAGDTTSTNLPTHQALYPTFPGATSSFLLKLSQDGQVLRSLSYFGGSGIDKVEALRVTPAGDIYLAGSTASKNLPIKNAVQSANAGGTDGFLLHIAPTGDEIVFSTYLGGTGTDAMTDMALDQDNHLILAGYTDSTDFPVLNALYPASAGKLDAFVAKLDHSGRFLHFASYLGGENNDLAQAVALDSDDDPTTGLRYIYLAGTTESNSFPADNAYQGYHAGAKDGFVVKLDPRGLRVVYASFFGGTSDDQVLALGTLPTAGSRSVLLAGDTNAVADFGFPISAGVLQPDPAGKTDQFVARIADTLYDATLPTLELSFIDDHYPEADFDPLDPSQQTGAHVTFDLVLHNPATTGVDISAISTLIEYDPEALRYEGTTWDPDTAASYPTSAVGLAVDGAARGELSLAIYQSAATPTAIADGVRLAEVQFEIRGVGDPAENPPQPSKLLNLTQHEATALNLANREVRIVGASGGILITRPCNRLIGDCDCSSTVQLAEVQVAAQTATAATDPAPRCMKIDGRTSSVGITDMQLMVNNFIHRLGEAPAVPDLVAAFTGEPSGDDAWWAAQPAATAVIGFGEPRISGRQVTTNLTLSESANRIAALIIDLYYDETKLREIAPTIGSAASAAGKSLNFGIVEPGWMRLLIYGLNDTPIADGVVADLSLEATIDLARERTTLEQAPSASSPAAQSLPIQGQSLELGPTPDQVLLTVANHGSGSGSIRGNGIDCGRQCSQGYASGTELALAADADSGSTFAGWSGPCGGSGTCRFRILKPASLTANFLSNDSLECATGARTLVNRDFGGETLIRSEQSLLTSGSVVIRPQADVFFEATQRILLRTGFQVAPGGRFKAHLAAASCQN